MDQATGINVNIPRSVVADILLERFEQLGVPRPRGIEPASRRALPAIGAAFEGGIYAGVTVHDNAPHALVLLPGESAELNWQDAISWTETNSKGELPSRFDALVLFKNLKGEFKPEYYWTSEQHASDESSAWMQDFYDGDQYYYHKGSVFRARAVRRVAI